MEERILNCVEKWKCGYESDEKIINAQRKFNSWLSKIPDEYKEISMILIEHLQYFSKATANSLLKELHSIMALRSTVTDENTIYTFIRSKDGKTNSSNDYWTEYRLLNKINKEICYQDIKKIENEQWEQIDNIVFIDDFSGTGDSFIKELKNNEAGYAGKNVYFITINIMKSAITNIEKYALEKEINFIPLFSFSQSKAFERDLFNDNERAKKDIINMSYSLGIPENDWLGYKDSQALIAFYNNTPNNTIGFIRYSNKTYESLFPRDYGSKPSWQTMKNKRATRKKTNYINSIELGV